MTFKWRCDFTGTHLGGLIVNNVALADSVSAQTGRDTVRRSRRGPVLPAAGELGGTDTSRHAPQDEQAEQPRPLHKRHSTPVSGTGPRLSAVSRRSAFGWRGLLGDENLLGEPSPRAGCVVWPTEGRGFEFAVHSSAATDSRALRRSLPATGSASAPPNSAGGRTVRG